MAPNSPSQGSSAHTADHSAIDIFMDDIDIHPSSEGCIFVEKVPLEIQQRICAFLSPSDEDPWSNKNALKVLSSTCKTLRKAALRDLFKHTTLKFSFTYDASKSSWRKPKLVSMLESEQAAIKDVHSGSELKKYVQAVRLMILPMPDGPWETEMSRLEEAGDHIRRRFDTIFSNPIYSPCLPERGQFPENSHPFDTDPSADILDNQFRILFGKTNGHLVSPVETCAQEPTDRDRLKRQVFADYVLSTTQQVVNCLPSLKHIEPGLWWHDERTYQGMVYGYFESRLVRRYSIAFETAILCKLRYPQDKLSLAIRGMPLAFAEPETLAGMSHTLMSEWIPLEISRYCFELMATQLPQLSITNLSIYVDSGTRFPVKQQWGIPTQWPDIMTYWGNVLSTMAGLKRLHLVNSGTKFERGKKAIREPLFLGLLLQAVKMPKLEALRLEAWSVTDRTITERLPKALPGLQRLEISFVDMISDAVDPWPLTLQELDKKYPDLQIWIDGLRRRSFKATHVSNLRKRLPNQTGLLWNRQSAYKLYGSSLTPARQLMRRRSPASFDRSQKS